MVSTDMGKRTTKGARRPSEAEETISAASSSKLPAAAAAAAGRGDAALTLANGFLAVPVALPRTTLRQSAQHWIYARKHTANSASSSSNDEQLVADRTLFLANLPIDTTESHLREIFLNAGPISVIKFRHALTSEEEDEREERAEGEEEDADESAVRTHHTARSQSAGSLSLNKVPRVVALPSMDPRVAMGSQPFLPTSSSAHVVFLDATSLHRALSALEKGVKWVDPFKSIRKEAQRQAQLDSQQSSASSARKSRTTTSASFLVLAGAGVPPTGLQFLLEQHNASRPELNDVKQWADSRIALYQYRKAHPLPRKIGVRGVTVGPNGELLDEDGFIIVQRSGKYGRAGTSAATGGSVAIAKSNFQENQKKKSAGLQDFYRFQMREKKREQLADLRSKFEADKEKVAKLKAGRRFKPY